MPSHNKSAKSFYGRDLGVTLRANVLMKRNVDALLRGRKQTRKDLADWCRKSESWISKIMAEDRREFPMKYFDRIADFFGIATYQLLQPGISSLTERRAGRDRRALMERRVGRSGLMKPTIAVSHQAALNMLFSYLDENEQADFVKTLGEQVRKRLPPPMRGIDVAGPASVGKTPAATDRKARRETARKARDEADDVRAQDSLRPFNV